MPISENWTFRSAISTDQFFAPPARNNIWRSNPPEPFRLHPGNIFDSVTAIPFLFPCYNILVWCLVGYGTFLLRGWDSWVFSGLDAVSLHDIGKFRWDMVLFGGNNGGLWCVRLAILMFLWWEPLDILIEEEWTFFHWGLRFHTTSNISRTFDIQTCIYFFLFSTSICCTKLEIDITFILLPTNESSCGNNYWNSK